MFQQGVGINGVMFYSTKLFDSDPKMSINDSYVLNGVIGFANCFSTLITLNLIDSVGRKKIGVVGSAIMCPLLIAIFLFDLFKYLWVVTVMVILYIINFAYSLGPLLWIYLPEILPEKGLAMATCLQWIFTVGLNIGNGYLLMYKMKYAFIVFACFALGVYD